MFTLPQLRGIALAKIKDATVLVRAGRFDSGVYMCGYAVEIALKAKIWRNLGWTHFPEDDNDWKKHSKVFKVHDFNLLLEWAGCADLYIRLPHSIHWDRIKTWNPDKRYKLSGTVLPLDAKQAVRSALALVNNLCPR